MRFMIDAADHVIETRFETHDREKSKENGVSRM